MFSMFKKAPVPVTGTKLTLAERMAANQAALLGKGASSSAVQAQRNNVARQQNAAVKNAAAKNAAKKRTSPPTSSDGTFGYGPGP